MRCEALAEEFWPSKGINRTIQITYNRSQHLREKRKTWRISYMILWLLAALNAKHTETVGHTWCYFILNDTVRLYQRLGWSAENNSFGSEEGKKKTDLEECLKREVTEQTEGTMQKCLTVRNECTHGRKKISGQHIHVKYQQKAISWYLDLESWKKMSHSCMKGS